MEMESIVVCVGEAVSPSGIQAEAATRQQCETGGKFDIVIERRGTKIGGCTGKPSLTLCCWWATGN